MVVKAVVEEDVGLVSDGGGEGIAQDPSEDAVSVPISPSDMLVMYFKVPPVNFNIFFFNFFCFLRVMFNLICGAL